MRIFSCLSAPWPTSARWDPASLRKTAGYEVGGSWPSAIVVLALLLAGGLSTAAIPGTAPLHAQWPGEIRGIVVDARTGEGVGAARVTVEGTALTALSEGNGRFRLRAVEEGVIRLHVRRAGYAPTEISLRIRPGVTHNPTIRIEPSAMTLEPVRVVGDRGPADRVLLTRERIRASGAATLGELVDRLPGVTVVRRGPGGAETLAIRGASADQTLVLVDGVPLNDPVTGVADLSTLSPESVEQIELLAGARSARYGPGAVGGVLLVTTTRVHAPLEASAGIGSLGERRGMVELGTNVLGLRARGGVHAASIRGDFPFERDERVGGGRTERENADRGEFAVRLTLGSAEGARESDWEISSEFSRLERGIPGRSYAPSRQARQALDQGRVRGRLVRSLRTDPRPEAEAAGPGAGGSAPELRLRAGGELRRLRFRDPAPPLGPAFDHRSRVAMVDFGGEIDGLTWGRDRVRWGGGGELRALLLDSDQLDSERSDRTSTWGGFFLHGEARPPDLPFGPSFHSAVRADLGPDGAVASHELSMRGRIGAVNLSIAHRSAYSPPSPADQFFREGVGVAPNPDLRAERIPGELEIGLSAPVQWGSVRSDLAATWFRSDIRDHIVWAPDFRFVWSPRNVDVRRRGWTLRTEVGSEGRGVVLSGHLTRASVRYVRAGSEPSSQLAYRPLWSGALAVVGSVGAWRLTLRARYIGARYPVPAPVNELEGFWTTSLTAARTIQYDGWRIDPSLHVDRVMDDRTSFIFSVPEPGRTLRVELRLRRAPASED